jgi:hypothetical protein
MLHQTHFSESEGYSFRLEGCDLQLIAAVLTLRSLCWLFVAVCQSVPGSATAAVHDQVPLFQ